MDSTQKEFLTAKARQLRNDAIETIGRFGSGHIGGSMSVMDALTVIYYAKANVDPKDPKKQDRDRVIMSKGHAGPAMYAVLAGAMLLFVGVYVLMNVLKKARKR